MKIDYTELWKKYWFEDREGNIVDESHPKAVIYKSCFPLQLHQNMSEYCYHPKNRFIKLLCKNNRIYNLISKGKPKTFKHLATFTTTFSGDFSQRCIVAMVNSGDFTLEEAIWVYANSCERCMNVLIFKYLEGEDGYPEYSEDWHKANTQCKFCEEGAE